MVPEVLIVAALLGLALAALVFNERRDRRKKSFLEDKE